MTSISDEHASNRRLLSENLQFQILPKRVQAWVEDSPLACVQFARFFRDGGIIRRESTEPLASYIEQTVGKNSPAIRINPGYYPLLDREGKDPIEMEKALFAMLAHEIGHHTANSRTHAFTGSTREANVQYRAEHEAMAVLNAFRIFEELRERDPHYVPSYGQVGYGSNLAVGMAYLRWHEDQDDRAVIRELSAIVLTAEDTRTKAGRDNVPDYNNDGTVTHAERFRRDWEESERRKQKPPSDPSRSQPDPRDTDHPNHALYESAREKARSLYAQHGITLPDNELARFAASVTVDARRSGMTHVDHLLFSENRETGEVELNGNLIAIQGRLDDPANRFSATPTQQAAQTPVEESFRQLEVVDRQQSQRLAQFQEQQQQLSQSPGGPRMTL